MHKTGWYIDLRIVFTHSFEHEIPNLVFNLVSLEKKFGAIVSWVLNALSRGTKPARSASVAVDSIAAVKAKNPAIAAREDDSTEP